jgi:hypothetical protein
MLNPGESYLDNGMITRQIEGKIKDYSKEKPFVYSLCGNWYHEETGQFVSYRKGDHCLLHVHNYRSISNHIKV